MDQSSSPPAPGRDEAPAHWELKAADLEFPLDPDTLGFRTTAELEPLDHVVGQDRALRALEFGLAMRQRGYNIYVSGLTSTGRKQLVKQLVEARARQEPTPDDWVYLHNFDESDRPLAFRLPPGHGVRLRTALADVVSRLQHDLPRALQAKDFDAERERLGAAYGRRSEALYDQLVARARELAMGVRRLPNGVIVFVPLKDDKPLESADVERLTDEERADIARRQGELGAVAADLMARQQDLSRELREEVEEIVRALGRRLLAPLLDRVKLDHLQTDLARWLDRMRDHMLDHLELFHEDREEPTDLPAALQAAMERRDPFLPYRVNVVVDNSHTEGAPVVVEIAPNYRNLFGVIERDVNLFGHVTTDFTHIKPGSLLRANGGYLIVDLDDALTEPLVWKQLKETLESGQLLTDVYEPFALLAGLALKPQPVPLTTRVVAVGSEELYYLLQFYDNDFRELFKVRADFGPEMARTADNQHAYARFIAKLARAEGLLPFAATAVVEVIRFGTRAAAHRGKLSVEFGDVADVVCEASHWARHADATLVEAAHVRKALDERVYRADRIAAKVRELIEEDTLRIAVQGTRVGQVNGLSVWDLGDFRFGRPNRVTASVGVGQEGLVNVERESDLSGSTHDKGVLILEGYLRNRYAREHPLALSASLTFEQSYGWVEGDSASSAELYCLLSGLAGVPLRQDIAVTGSVDQHGAVQAVGGVNEKIEGFFDICRLRGLTGTQGACIPRANVRHLILRPDVIEAVRSGRFHIWAIDTIDEGIELLTGLPAGDLTQEGTFHYLLDQRLQGILALLQEQPASGAAPRVRFAPGAAPRPSPPPLPGERG